MRRVRYAVPSLLTSVALLFAFGALIAVSEHRHALACVAVLLAMVFDGLDGRVARLTSAQSAFGGEYDSLADMCAFGMAPALIAWDWGLRELGRWGFGVGFLFVACAALRLARFNLGAGKADKRWFEGLPSPAAAAGVTGYVWWSVEAPNAWGAGSPGLCLVAVAVAALAMVSRVRYFSGKTLRATHWVGAIAGAAAVAGGLALVGPPRAALPAALCGLVWIYALAGFVLHGVSATRAMRLRARKARRACGARPFP